MQDVLAGEGLCQLAGLRRQRRSCGYEGLGNDQCSLRRRLSISLEWIESLKDSVMRNTPSPPTIKTAGLSSFGVDTESWFSASAIIAGAFSVPRYMFCWMRYGVETWMMMDMYV